jgi:hypothetical protein
MMDYTKRIKKLKAFSAIMNAWSYETGNGYYKMATKNLYLFLPVFSPPDLMKWIYMNKNNKNYIKDEICLVEY